MRRAPPCRHLHSRGAHHPQPPGRRPPPAYGGVGKWGVACCHLSFTKTSRKMDVRKAPAPRAPRPTPRTPPRTPPETPRLPPTISEPRRGLAQLIASAEDPPMSTRQHRPCHDAAVSANRSQDPQRRQEREPRSAPGAGAAAAGLAPAPGSGLRPLSLPAQQRRAPGQPPTRPRRPPARPHRPGPPPGSAEDALTSPSPAAQQPLTGLGSGPRAACSPCPRLQLGCLFP